MDKKKIACQFIAGKGRKINPSPVGRLNCSDGFITGRETNVPPGDFEEKWNLT